jgi:hypothetical protein
MKKFYRIQHPLDGYGIFTSKALKSFDFPELDVLICRHLNTFPNPHDDKGITDIFPDEYCAFKSIKQIREVIFPEELDVLINDIGYRVYELVFDCYDYLEGEYQITFKRENVVEMNDITEAFLGGDC